jgi:hypothetical protein
MLADMKFWFAKELVEILIGVTIAVVGLVIIGILQYKLDKSALK